MSTSTIAPTNTAALVTIGHGGHSLYFLSGPYRELEGGGRTREVGGKLTGYCTSLESFMREVGKHGKYLIPAGTPIVDLTTGDWEALVRFSTGGPMANTDLPPGHVQALLGEVVPRTDDSDIGSLSYVAVDVWLDLLTRRVPNVTIFYSEEDLLH